MLWSGISVLCRRYLALVVVVVVVVVDVVVAAAAVLIDSICVRDAI
jgi:hypothetical protein